MFIDVKPYMYAHAPHQLEGAVEKLSVLASYQTPIGVVAVGHVHVVY